MAAVVFVLLASLLFGTTGTAQAFGPEASPLSIGAARIVIGGGALAVIGWLVATRARRRATAPAVRRPIARSTALVIVIGALGVILYQPAFFLGTGRNGVAIGTLVALGSAPVLTGALNWLLGRRFPGWRWIIATLVAGVGIVLLGGGGDAAQPVGGGGVDGVGLLGSLGAGLSYAVYTLASKRLLDDGWSPSGAMGAVFGSAAVLGAVVLAFTDVGWLLEPAGVAMALWLGLATVTVAYLLFARGLRVLSAPTVSTLTLAEPLTASVLGILVLGESLAGTAWLGLACVAAGIVILVVAAPSGRRPIEVRS